MRRPSQHKLLAVNWRLFFVGDIYFARPVVAEATLPPGDTIEVKLGGVPSTETQSVSGEYQIDGDGFVNMPNIGKARIGGLSAAAAQTAIESVYRQKEIYTHPTTSKKIRANPSLDLHLQPGDKIEVPQSLF